MMGEANKNSPKYWDEHPEVFIKDLAKRLAIDEPVDCGKIMFAVESMINWTGSYASMRRSTDQIYKDAKEHATTLLKAALEDIFNFPCYNYSGWDVCDRWQLDEELEEVLDKITKLVRESQP